MEIVGNSNIREQLENICKQGQLPPSFLFAGKQGLGKYLTALWFMARILCSNQDSAPCWKCAGCSRVLSNNHPDIFILEKTEGKSSIGIDDIRQGIASVQTQPYEGQYRFWVIPEAERLTEEAQSAMLKTLEEPPSRLILILIATSPRALLPTVVSRCRLYHFQAAETQELSEFLQSKGYSPEQSFTAARVCEGCPGRAILNLADENVWRLRDSTLQAASQLYDSDIWEAVSVAQELESLKFHPEDPKIDLMTILDTMATFYRDTLLLNAGSPKDLLTNLDYLEAIESLAQKANVRFLENALEQIMTAKYHLERNVQSKLLLQRLCLLLTKGA